VLGRRLTCPAGIGCNRDSDCTKSEGCSPHGEIRLPAAAGTLRALGLPQQQGLIVTLRLFLVRDRQDRNGTQLAELLYLRVDILVALNHGAE